MKTSHVTWLVVSTFLLTFSASADAGLMLPFVDTQQWGVSQGWCEHCDGAYPCDNCAESHCTGVGLEYSIDFISSTGYTLGKHVLAAGDGVVVEIENEVDCSGCPGWGNYVIIDHEDSFWQGLL